MEKKNKEAEEKYNIECMMVDTLEAYLSSLNTEYNNNAVSFALIMK